MPKSSAVIDCDAVAKSPVCRDGAHASRGDVVWCQQDVQTGHNMGNDRRSGAGGPPVGMRGR